MYISLLSGCAERVPSLNTQLTYQQIRQVLENATTPPAQREEPTPPMLSPIFKEVSPLKKTLTVAFYQEHYENVFFFLAYEIGLSLVIDPEIRKLIPPDREKITLQMKNQPAEEILKRVCQILDLHYKVERGVLLITPYEERTFNLGFIPVIKEGRTAMGGDVLGNIWQADLMGSPLRGEFTINAQVPSDSLDIYKNLEEILSTLVIDKKAYTLNRLTGTLYVRERPSKVNTIAKLIEEIKKTYKRQIILDAKIIEVELSKGHNLGVDWFEITNFLMGNNRVSFNTLDLGITTQSNQPSFALTISGQPNVNLLLNLLKEYGELKVISNLKVRVLHSQPALISVGTSQSYIREVKRDIISPTTTTSTVTYTTQTSSVFDGILLGITPFISGDDEIFLHIVPIKSDLVELKDVRFGENYFITLPRVNLREMTSIVKAKPNDLIVIGGLILDVDRARERRIAIPILSELFRSNVKSSRKAELVILIRLLVS